jgi:hypothetical protein
VTKYVFKINSKKLLFYSYLFLKDIHELYELYHVRENLTRRAYKHETGCSINQMVIEALTKADKYFKFSTMIENQDIDTFEKLTDDVFIIILHFLIYKNFFINNILKKSYSF